MPDHYPGTDIGKPPPRHTLTAAAEHARGALVAYAYANPQIVQIAVKGSRKGKPEVRRVPRESIEPSIVSRHLSPWRQVPIESLKGAAATFAKLATAKGHEVAAKAAGVAVCVAVRGVGVRLYWVDGLSKGGTLNGHKTTVTAARAAL